MIVYNVTVKIKAETAEEWLTWMRTKHIPDVMATGMFLSYRLLRIMHDDDPEAVGYAIQYICKDQLTFQNYVANFAKDLQKEHSEKFKNSYIAIRTLMEIVEEKAVFASDS